MTKAYLNDIGKSCSNINNKNVKISMAVAPVPEVLGLIPASTVKSPLARH